MVGVVCLVVLVVLLVVLVIGWLRSVVVMEWSSCRGGTTSWSMLI